MMETKISNSNYKLLNVYFIFLQKSLATILN